MLISAVMSILEDFGSLLPARPVAVNRKFSHRAEKLAANCNIISLGFLFLALFLKMQFVF